MWENFFWWKQTAYPSLAGKTGKLLCGEKNVCINIWACVFSNIYQPTNGKFSSAFADDGVSLRVVGGMRGMKMATSERYQEQLTQDDGNGVWHKGGMATEVEEFPGHTSPDAAGGSICWLDLYARYAWTDALLHCTLPSEQFETSMPKSCWI